VSAHHLRHICHNAYDICMIFEDLNIYMHVGICMICTHDMNISPSLPPSLPPSFPPSLPPFPWARARRLQMASRVKRRGERTKSSLETGHWQSSHCCKASALRALQSPQRPQPTAADPPRAEERPVERVSRHVGRLLHVMVARAQEAAAIAVAHRCQRLRAGAHRSRVLAPNPTAVQTCMDGCL
jgi:hypothetical protein